MGLLPTIRSSRKHQHLAVACATTDLLLHIVIMQNRDRRPEWGSPRVSVVEGILQVGRWSCLLSIVLLKSVFPIANFLFQTHVQTPPNTHRFHISLLEHKLCFFELTHAILGTSVAGSSFKIMSFRSGAEFAKLPLIPLYLQPGNHQFTNGMNFASGGAGALAGTNQGLICAPFAKILLPVGLDFSHCDFI
ncbi:hypothetical protein SADUNF_Sadunf17G0124100 [Salix dunnii]|uniref:Uncharacterized protein n=1 Tax=Salix dunnii TaxID=1413687 RepID=A0A835MHR5_9ROSI|nr:hypothetical protein SADUNF_Sadunf17G0124100 [Salix dunnii]